MHNATRRMRFQPLGLSFEIPCDAAFRVQADDRELATLLLSGLSQIYDRMRIAITPTASIKTVTDQVSIIATANPDGQNVQIYSHGPSECLVLETGENPAYANGGSVPVDIGNKLNIGDDALTCVPISTPIKAVCPTGGTANLLVIIYPNPS
jgi:hypothetical protein